MNKENHQTIFKNFAKTMAWLEKYIEKSNYYSDWEEKRQINVTIGSGINEANEVRGRFLTCLTCFETILGCNETFDKETLKTNFFQWISAVKISVDNCPADLALLLYYFHEVLEGRGEKLLEQVWKDADQAISKMSKEEREKGWNEFLSVFKEQWQKKVIEKWEFNPNGKAEEGRETFQKIVNNIDNYNLFPEDETIPDDDSPEAQAAIKELEGLLEEKWTSLSGKDPELLEKTIQKLEDFESNNTANGSKNNYAWKKLEAGAKLMDLKMKKTLLGEEFHTPPETKSNKENSNLDNNSTPFLTIIVISIVFVFLLGVIVYLEKKEQKKKKTEP